MNPHRKTILVIASGFVVIGVLSKNYWFFIPSGLVLIAGFTSDKMAMYIHDFWMKLAHLMGKITQPVILGLVYFPILWPMALISRIGGKDRLMLKNRSDSTFKIVDKSFTKETFEKTW